MAEEIAEEQPEAGLLNKIKTHKWKILGGVLGILVFAGAVFGAYKLGQRKTRVAPTPVAVATPTPDLYTEASRSATADWKTYTNTETGFLVKYPPTLEIINCSRVSGWPENNFAFKDTEDPTVYCESDAFPPFSIIVTPTTEKEIRPYPSSREFEITETEIKIDGRKAFRATAVKVGEAPGPDRFIFARVINRGRLYHLQSDRESDFNLMLSTFKFLE